MGNRFKYKGYIFLIVLAILTLDGCHVFKKTVSGAKSVSDDENLVRKIVNTQPAWKFMELRLTGKAIEDDQRIGFMGTVKMEKDKQIFVLLRSMIGIELARVYANRDSVWVISKMLGIKERGDWKLAVGKLGYPVDFNAIQGILVQSLFTSTGDQMTDLLDNLVVKTDRDSLRLVSNTNLKSGINKNKYFIDFLINKVNFMIDGTKIRDINGQWIADITYLYNKENLIKKVELKGIDSERNFAVDLNVVKRDLKDFIEINFDKF
ncbi:MAG: DUF4292 domain-containing protein [Bacteroidales bacterium]